MNLEKLFQMQKKLDARILAEHPVKENEDRLSKKILALHVELGELANEWQQFKYWKANKEPRTKKLIDCPDCNGKGVISFHNINVHMECDRCNYTGKINKNPMLEEYIDSLHFILSIGNDIDYRPVKPKVIKTSTIIDQFHELFYLVTDLRFCINDGEAMIRKYLDIFEHFLGLGEMLGFTWEDITVAYLDKNKVNHQRQESGY